MFFQFFVSTKKVEADGLKKSEKRILLESCHRSPTNHSIKKIAEIRFWKSRNE